MNKRKWIGLALALVIAVIVFHYVRDYEENELSQMDNSFSELASRATEQLREVDDTVFSHEVDIIRLTQGDDMAYKVKAGQASIISLECNVEDASVYADGKFMGRAKANYEYGSKTADPYLFFALSIPNEGRDASKPRKILVTKSGYQRFETAVMLNQRDINVNVSLTKKNP